MSRLHCNQNKQKSTDTLRSLQNANRIPVPLRMQHKRMDRRNEKINETLTEEVRRREQREKRSDRTIVEVPEPESTASEPGKNPIEPEANPKRRLFMKSASLTASGSGKQKQKRSIPDEESGMQVEDTLQTDTVEGTASSVAPSANV